MNLNWSKWKFECESSIKSPFRGFVTFVVSFFCRLRLKRHSNKSPQFYQSHNTDGLSIHLICFFFYLCIWVMWRVNLTFVPCNLSIPNPLLCLFETEIPARLGMLSADLMNLFIFLAHFRSSKVLRLCSPPPLVYVSMWAILLLCSH